MNTAENKAVFLSYASQDADAARRICDALRATGVEVWLDQSELVGGDAWDAKIRGQIASCALFVPVISANTQARREGYFRLEWKLAAQRTHMMSERTAFLLPVVIDATRDAEADVPAEFRAVQWTRLKGGEATPAFIQRVQQLLGPSSASKSTGGSSQPAPTLAPGAKRKTSRAVAISLAVVLVAATAGAVWFAGDREARPASPEQPDKSIAVLPFANLSDDKENTAFFSDGMHEDILTNLANIRDLKVISRTSVMEYRGTTKKMPQIARELGVAYILEGSVRRAGSQVVITGQLILAAHDEHLWAKRYDRELTPKEMFSIQAALATEIAGALRAVISPQTKKLLERRPTENLAAYDLYVKSRDLDGPGRSALQEKEKLLQEAVAKDPNFAEAWGALAATHAAFVYWDIDTTSERLREADNAIARAVRLAPDSPEVILHLGRYALRGYRDYTRATAQFEKVLQLQPSNSEAFASLGFLQRRQGRWREALENFRKAAELDPGNEQRQAGLYTTLQGGHRWAEAIAALQRQIAMMPDDLVLPNRLARLIFQATGSTSEADALLSRLTPEQLDSPRILLERKYWANVKGDFAEWKRLNARHADDYPDDESRWSRVVSDALILAAHGETTTARARVGNSPAEIRSTLERQPNNATLLSMLAVMEVLLGENEQALRDARQAAELVPDSVDPTAVSLRQRALAIVYAWMGRKDLATAELERLLRFPSMFNYRNSVHTLRVDPAFAPLRGDPKFEALLKDPKNHAPLF